MSVNQHEIDRLKEDFNEITNKKAEDKPEDFSAYLHLIQIRKIERVFSWIKANHITHQPGWADIKNYNDQKETWK